MLDIKTGRWAKHKGEWAYICGIYEGPPDSEESYILLSGWRGLKTKTILSHQVEDVKETHTKKRALLA